MRPALSQSEASGIGDREIYYDRKSVSWQTSSVPKPDRRLTAPHQPDHDDVPNLDRVERLANASHWVHHDEAERVNQLLIEFFAPARPTSTT